MGNDALAALVVTARTGDEPFLLDGEPIGAHLAGFWRWACSDLVNNAMRGVLAEYIVGLSLGSVSDRTRVEWDACDLVTDAGCKVEVKSAAYIQSWAQKQPSPIQFNIKPSYGWNAASNTSDTERRRQADVYVFALLAHTDKLTVDPLNLDQWSFYVLSTERLNAGVGNQRTLSLGALLNLRPTHGRFGDLPALVNDAFE
jgi:hypothetical protein